MADLALDPDRTIVQLPDGTALPLGCFVTEDVHTLQRAAARCELCDGTDALRLNAGRFVHADRTTCAQRNANPRRTAT